MSTPQLISPLLDGFVMGDPISGHDGVCSCPAMKLDTEQKYIVKVISIPAAQSKLDALLLAGAYADRGSALVYFKELADGVIEEAELLRKLSKHEGFVSFEDWQMVPMEDGETGYDIYLLGAYHPTVANILKANEMTHLGAVNLGLDLCAALTVSRRFGYIYGNLRPSNIYICNEREFRIGDLGFLSMDSLPYASLPDKYRSDYTPPEISDAYSALNSTMDTYAVGLILYQAFNGGQLPPVGYSTESPRYADYELSQIILKACALNPEERWQDPVEMGQALVNYLQSNSVNDILIVPPAPIEEAEPEEESADEEISEPTTEDIIAEVDLALESALEIIVAASDSEEIPVEGTAEEADAAEELYEVVPEVAPAPEPAEETSETEEAEDTATTESTEEVVEEIPAETDETDEILAQADDLIAHQLPDPVVVPEAIEVTLPEVELPLETPAEEEISEDIEEDVEDAPLENESEEQSEDESEDKTAEEDEEEQAPHSKKRRNIFLIIAASVLAILLIVGGFLYQNVYHQTINDMVLSGTEDCLTVTLDTSIPDEKLTVKCWDISGNSQTQPVRNGIATFIGLKPGTKYTFEVRISGFHKLLGETTRTYNTAKQTVINGFYAVTGPEDGSVILSFAVQGPDSTQWKITYSTEGEEEKTATFNGHMVTLTGLTLGKEYTFDLKPVSELYITGECNIRYVATEIVYAENLQIVSFAENRLHLTWACPAGKAVEKWHVRCYNNDGYDQTLTCTETQIIFEDLDMTASYTIEVTADGMKLGTPIYLTADSIQVQNIQFNSADRNHLVVTWDFLGNAPADGWLLLYKVDNSADQQVVNCSTNFGTITPLIPGAHYSIVIQSADGTTLLGAAAEYDAPKAAPFSGYLINASHIEFFMCKTEDVPTWDGETTVTTYAVGESASFVLHATRRTEQVSDRVVTLYVIRDSEGNLVSCNYESRTWDNMWNNRYCKLTIPVMPETAGQYTAEIYFDGTAVSTQSFEIK